MSAFKQTIWDRIPSANRKKLIKSLWWVTWILLVLGLFNTTFLHGVIALSTMHLILFIVLFGFKISPFPVQLRLAYLAWVTAGIYIPELKILIYITIVGLAANLLFGYCLLARMMYLLPWNKEEKFSWNLVKRVILTPPVEGKFKPSAV
jgi:hypothetical protein